ncbi:D-alanyl-D-alanine carboxypeptidase/D-alanyl-D-alanine-endopeptidase [Roseovarius spongiae]|uniref:D-alanyl-D-alanine carboxypeptidase/D-alanyl-D-alanine-endopeptidase n=1 Tax=Roseovarius spongiae TaxID=2320272 RepID=A0A3A8AQR4_9RHOB|nr:D-alanyl-D-alanine carboxypeptidase/D-alanyl-D-alanine-endopeptidase [Roseovarius spongiae]RKF12913.1 D-alanyl-D-alanine carboxypeptidase/D-alanyl-D-alanine-endopeptidase [Roseovarius spongiae]
MSREFSRRAFLTTALAGFAVAAEAGAPAVSLRPQLRPAGLRNAAARPPSAPDPQDLIDAARLGGRVGYAVIDEKTGALLETRNATVGFPPASVTKMVTTLYALDALGPDYRFRTRLIATGPVRDGAIDGDLVLAGGGDPVLDTDALADMAADLKKAGVHGVTGDFRVYSGALPYVRVIDEGQPDHVGYNPSLSGINLNFNRVHFQWVREDNGYTVDMDARSAKYRPEVRVARMSIANRAAPVYTYRNAGDHDEWTVARSALGKSGSRWLPVRHPASYAGEVFATFARAHGIRLDPPKVQSTPPEGKALVTHESIALHDILRGMLKYSNNLTAELVGMTATVARRGKVGSLAASGREMSAWAQSELGMRGAKLVDHSGLGAGSRLSAEALARAMARVDRARGLAPLLKPFKMRDANGRIDRNHPIEVLAKTGTLYFVSTLSGYATGPGGRRLAFAILTGNEAQREALNGEVSDRPPGAAAWNRRSKRLQQQLIERWDAVYGG